MKVWDYNLAKVRKRSPAYRKWRLERLINYGLDRGDRISAKELKRYWAELKISPQRRALLKDLLWQKKRR
ncbi:MAG: hypothetical protein WAP74_00365 [Patescibacteria group bacterium]